MARSVFASKHDPSAGSLEDRLLALSSGDRLTIVGLKMTSFVQLLPVETTRLLRLDLASSTSVDVAVDRILDDLADLALINWPNWPPSPLAPWRRAADRLAAVGRRPRFSARVPAATQFAALYPAASRPTLVFSLDPIRAERAAPLIAVIEWVCRQGGATIALLSEMPLQEAPWDRVLFGALVFKQASPSPAITRLVPPSTARPRGSAVERRVRAALRDSPDLADLFEDEVTIRLGPLGPTPRVDMLWRVGKVVVEIDGAEHERDSNYGADRHRDYELLVSGYLVLRLTNAEVERDLARALEKIRRVVGLRRTA